MIRILVFGLSTRMGGVETYLMNLYRNLDSSKIQFDFVVSGDSCYFSDEIKKLGGGIFYITAKKDNVFGNILDLLKVLRKCKKTHRIVYFNLSALYYNLPFIFAKFYRFPIVISHGHTTRIKGQKKNIRYYLHCINRLYVAYASDYLFACSKHAAEWVLGEKVVKKGKVRIIPNSIPTENFKYDEDARNSIRNALGIEKGQLVLGSVGRITYLKNQSFLLDIFKEIREINKDSVLLLVGDGDLRKQIEQKVLDLGMSNNVILTGESSNVPQLLQAMDTFILPSHSEGFGIVLIEAQTTGLHCFTSKDVVPNEVDITGLVKFIELDQSPKYWAEQIIKCSKVSKRQDRIEKTIEAGYDIKEGASKFQKFITFINSEVV